MNRTVNVNLKKIFSKIINLFTVICINLMLSCWFRVFIYSYFYR